MNIRLIEEQTKTQVNLSLSESPELKENSVIVYADKKYLIEIFDFEGKIDIFVNDKNIGIYEKGTVNLFDNKFFSESVGYCYLRFVFHQNKKTELFSQYINVCILEEKAKPLKSMINYIFDNSDLLTSANVPNLDLDNFLGVNLNKQFYQKISLIREIVNRYKKQYLYFKNNQRCKLQYKENINHITKLTKVDSSTLNYIVQHIDNLEEVKNSNIVVNDHCFLPNKVLMKENQKTAIFYENKILVNFIFTVLISIQNIQGQVDIYWEILRNENIRENYISPTKLLEDVVKAEILRLKNVFEKLKKELLEIFKMYIDLFPIHIEPLYYCPLPTNIFIEIKEYRYIYELIRHWFETGTFKIEQQDLFSPLLIDNKIYEFYVLTKLCNYFNMYCGLDLLDKKNFLYDKNISRYFRNNICNNTFVFSDYSKKITLYYEPVICTIGHLKKKCKNGIDIIRNNKVSVNRTSGTFYLPDFIIKIEDNMNKTKYLVLDAKYSTREIIKKYQLVDLVFKYLFSFTCLENSYLLGLGIICGKDELLKKESIFDEKAVEYIDKPFVNFISFPEMSEENFENKQFELLRDFFEKI